MKIKTYQAPTMQEALRAVKAELGPDAVILSTKQLSQGKAQFGLIGRVMVEVTAAIDMDHRPLDTPPEVLPRASSASDQRDELRREVPRFEDVLRSSMMRPTTPDMRTPAPQNATGGDDPGKTEWQRVLAEIKQLRECLGEAGSTGAAGGRMNLAPGLMAHSRHLLETGLEPSTVQSILEQVQRDIDLTPSIAESVVRRAIHDVITRQVSTSGPLLDQRGGKKTVILIGPTGVGKTTTIAKLAAHARLQERRSVALITLDTYRLAAVEQLRMYATLIGVTLDVALTRRDALGCIERRKQAELILIDTAGRSPRDAAGMEELKALVSLEHPVEVQLVLSAATRERDLMENMAQYRGIPVGRLLFTKLDETSSFGGIFDLMRRTGLPLSYFSTGQRVPEDLETVRAQRVAELLLSGAVGRVNESTHLER